MLKKSLIVIVFLNIILSGCGQSGPLYLPDKTINQDTAKNNDS